MSALIYTYSTTSYHSTVLPKGPLELYKKISKLYLGYYSHLPPLCCPLLVQKYPSTSTTPTALSTEAFLIILLPSLY